MKITTHHYVTVSIFATKLADHFYNKGDDLPELSKSEAKQILKDGLLHYGYNSEFAALDDLGDSQEIYNEIKHKAIKWIRDNYKSLD